MIKCGACGQRHLTVSDVRACYWQRQQDEFQVEDDHLAEVRYERQLESPEYYGLQTR